MRWPITIVVLMLALTISLGLYRLESKVQQLERRLAQATEKLEENRRNSRILAAEWSFLGQPGRLQSLTGRYLELRPVTPEQVATLAGVPLREGADGERREVAGGPDHTGDQPDLPPVPAAKPAKPLRGERLVVAERRDRP